MGHTNNLSKYVANFIDELVQNGVTDVVISPGSRSTPLAMLALEHEKIKEWVLVDERSAAFFALGIAKETDRPVALICTSGTAAANYYPAIIEAKHSRVPLLVLTADRPHELRNVGASQTINQIGMYGEFVKLFLEMALPDASESMLTYVRSRAARAVHEASNNNKGPVHLNFPFREPLVPNLLLESLWGESRHSHHVNIHGEKRLSESQLDYLMARLGDKKKGLIVCGPQADKTLATKIVELAEKWHIPVVADPLSQVRSTNGRDTVVIDGYDAFFKHESIRDTLKPDYIIRFGAMPVSKSYLFFVKQHKDVLKFVLENDSDVREPTNDKTEFIYAREVTLCEQLIKCDYDKQIDRSWLLRWNTYNTIVKNHVLGINSEQLTEGETVRHVLEHLHEEANLFIGNSMAVRDLDTFFVSNSNKPYIHANRGVSGIDGITSTALGVAAKSKEQVTLVVGDLAFYHDLNGLLTAKQYNLDMTIVLINNDGGGIFSFLPQSKEEKQFETLFGTPLNIDFKHVVKMYDGKYTLARDKETLIQALDKSYERGGLTVIEVQTDRHENVCWHRSLWSKIEEELVQVDQ